MSPVLDCFIPGLNPPPDEEGATWLRPEETPWLNRWLQRHPPSAVRNDPAQDAQARLLPGTVVRASAAWLAECQSQPALATAPTATLPTGSSLAFLHPVHLQAGIDTAVVLGERFLALTPDERRAFETDLRAFLAEDALHLLTAPSGRWYLAIPPDSPLGDAALPPLGEALNRSAQSFFEGDERRALRRWLTELQMWLYSHPVNAERARRGQPEMNSLWLWARSPFPATVNPAATPGAGTLFTDLPSLAGCWPGRSQLIDSRAIESLIEAIQQNPESPLHLVWTEPAYALLEGDFAGWQQALRTVEQCLASLPAGWRSRIRLDTGAGARALPGWRNLWGRLG
ncbi:hypothetical protein [Halothiobacillus sp. DCM-1]|uniref:hypothetical protein n=1 Tax=Halothiobacillus sp. DCM-1 TaxID=3112558 RepID=UPI003251CDC5